MDGLKKISLQMTNKHYKKKKSKYLFLVQSNYCIEMIKFVKQI